jgi:hypothetical protein
LRWALELIALISSIELLPYILRAISGAGVQRSRLFIVLFVVAWSALAQDSSKPSPAKEEEPRLETVLALKDPFLAGQVRTYYTPGFEKRAKEVQDFLADEQDFYSKELGIHLDLTVAVLDAKQWERLNILDPYGVPTVTDFPPYVALLPANWSENRLGMLPAETEADPALVKQVHAVGAVWSDTFYRGFDAIIGHEFGHAAARTYGIKPPTHWFDEFLATYFEIAFIRHRHPELAFPVQTFFAINRGYSHPYTSLNDFESRYPISDTSPTNYGWYQAMFEQRIEQVYALKGIDFLKQARTLFPANSTAAAPSRVEVLGKLDRICPGFTAWAEFLESTSRSK